MKIRTTNSMPNFIVRFWSVEKAHMLRRGWKDMPPKKFRLNYCSGRVEHVQSGDVIMFHTPSELLGFFEKHRLEK
jgi:hypothetical protein